MKVATCFSFSPELPDRLREAAAAAGVTRSWLVERVLAEWLDSRERFDAVEGHQPDAAAAGGDARAIVSGPLSEVPPWSCRGTQLPPSAAPMPDDFQHRFPIPARDDCRR